MANVTFTIPDANLAAVLSAFQTAYPGDWAAAQTAGTTAAAFCKAKVAEYVRGIYQGQNATSAADAARLASLTATGAVVIA